MTMMRHLHTLWHKVVSVAVAAVLVSGVCIPCAALADEPGGSGSGGTVNVTVNFVYERDSAMAAKPFRVQVAAGDSFIRDVSVPAIVNHTVPASLVEGLADGIVFVPAEPGGSGAGDTAGTVHFALESVTSDVTVNLFYVAGTAQYTVNHLAQNVQDDDYTLFRQETLTGSIDAYTAAAADLSVSGLVCADVQTAPVAADGTTEVNVYYERRMYTVAFDLAGGVDGPDPLHARYGTQYSVGDLPVPTRTGYAFAGWDPVPSGSVTENATYTAQWTPNPPNTNYTVALWGRNADGDGYSYLGSRAAAGVVGQDVAWDPDAYLCGLEEHVHTQAGGCFTYTCGLPEHTHSDACIQCTHVHEAACYGSTVQEDPQSVGAHSQSSILQNLAAVSGGSLQSGYIYYYGGGILGSHYYLYLDGAWYQSSASSCGDRVNTSGGGLAIRYSYYDALAGSCVHTAHDASCYICGLEEHAHSDACKTITCEKTEHQHAASCGSMRDLAPDGRLWEFESSDTVTVRADGTTVLNVYFDRTVFTLTFRSGTNGGATTYGTISDRWGADVSSRFSAICSSSGVVAWRPSTAGNAAFVNHVGIMPQENITYIRYNMSSGNQTMTYYGEDLNGNYQVMFTLRANFGNTRVSDRDRYEIEGYTIDGSRSTQNGARMNGAKFYYNRNSYDLRFYSSSTDAPDRTVSVKYGANLGSYAYADPPHPAAMDDGAVLLGWYRGPGCTGSAFDLASHTMPAADLPLFADWAAGLYTVETYTDASQTALYTYDGYSGRQENIVKYTLASEITPPQQPGAVFAGWFYAEAGQEKPFSFATPITRDYRLYPKFTDKAYVNYTVHYYKVGTTEKVADDEQRTDRIGRTVTEHAKLASALNLLPADRRNGYFPNATSTSAVLTADGMELAFSYTEAQNVPYTVKYVDADNADLLPAAQKTTDCSIVTETYRQIPGYVARQYQITHEMALCEGTENVIVFVYDPAGTGLTITNAGCSEDDVNQAFLYTVIDSDGSMVTVAVIGNGSATVSGLAQGEATVIQKSGWSWRYTPDSASKVVTLDADPDQNSVTFTNTRTGELWLSGGAEQKNVFAALSGSGVNG